MPDLHPYFKDINQAFEWYPAIEKQLVKAVKDINREYEIIIDVSSKQNWEQYQEKIINIVRNLNKDILINILDDDKDRYWIINADYKIIDKLGQSREICCIQIDIENAKRLGINYLDKKGVKRNPVIIHSAVPGGIERFIYMMLDNFPQSFPLWLYPVQVRFLSVSKKYVYFCQDLIHKYQNLPIRFEIDDRNESVSKKIKLAHEDLVPFYAVIGEREIKGNFKELDLIVEKIVQESKDKPFIGLNYSQLISKQIN